MSKLGHSILSRLTVGARKMKI